MFFQVDLVACETLIEVGDWLRERNIRFVVANVRSGVKATLVRGGVVAHLGESAFVQGLAAATAAEQPGAARIGSVP